MHLPANYVIAPTVDESSSRRVLREMHGEKVGTEKDRILALKPDVYEEEADVTANLVTELHNRLCYGKG